MWERVQLALTLLLLAALGALVGLYGAFLVPDRVAGVYWVGVTVTGVGNLALTTGGAWGTGRAAGAVAPTLGWLLAAYVTGTTRPTGGLVVPSSVPDVPGLGTAGSLFLLVGVVAAGAGIGYAVRHRRPQR